MENGKQGNEHGLGLDVLSAKQESTVNPFFRHESSDIPIEQPNRHANNAFFGKPAKKKTGRNAVKAVGGLGLKHLESSWENAESRLRSHKSITSSITQRKKSTKRMKAARNASTPRIQVDTNIQVQQTNVPLQVFPAHDGTYASHINHQPLPRSTDYPKDSSFNSQNRLSAVMSNTPRGKISWWLKGTT